MPKDPDEQIALFAQCVEALGGQRPSARAIGVSERSIRYMVTGQKALHDGILRQMAEALLEHATLCRQLERRISPAFAENLTARQLERMGKPDARRIDYKDS